MVKVLLVEDNDAVAEIYRTTLVDAGYEVENVVTAYTAVKTVLRGGIDLVIMDLLIEGADGVVTTIAMRGTGFSGPVIVITGGLMQTDETMYTAAGFSAKLIKPLINQEELVALVGHLIKESKE